MCIIYQLGQSQLALQGSKYTASKLVLLVHSHGIGLSKFYNCAFRETTLTVKMQWEMQGKLPITAQAGMTSSNLILCKIIAIASSCCSLIKIPTLTLDRLASPLGLGCIATKSYGCIKVDMSLISCLLCFQIMSSPGPLLDPPLWSWPEENQTWPVHARAFSLSPGHSYSGCNFRMYAYNPALQASQIIQQCQLSKKATYWWHLHYSP